MQTISVLFGLGNPGKKYQRTRHNMGFLLLDEIASRHGLRWSSPARTYSSAELTDGDRCLLLIRPRTFMNVCGRALREYAREGRFDPEGLLVLADDIALPLGRLRLRPRGSHGGHNGLRSIIEAVGTMDFGRLRMGVGPVPAGVDPADFVLDRFGDEEMPVVEQQIRRAAACVLDVWRDGFDRAMGRYNMAEPETD